MTKPKTLDQLQAEKEQAETQLAQDQHKLERYWIFRKAPRCSTGCCGQRKREGRAPGAVFPNGQRRPFSYSRGSIRPTRSSAFCRFGRRLRLRRICLFPG